MTELITTFLSVGSPHNELQRKYIKSLQKYLKKKGISAETLGETFWSVEAPLRPIHRKMREVYGCVVLALERYCSSETVYKKGSDSEKIVEQQCFTTVWAQIEAAMAYQLDLPLLICKEEKLAAEGMFDPAIHEWIIVRIHPDNPDELKENPIKGFIDSWINLVKNRYNSQK